MLAAIFLTIAIDSTPPAQKPMDAHDALQKVERYIDTVTYRYLDPSDDEIRGWREDERRYTREKSGKLQIRPTLYPSPWYKRPDVV